MSSYGPSSLLFFFALSFFTLSLPSYSHLHAQENGSTSSPDFGERKRELEKREREIIHLKEELDGSPYSASQLYKTAIPLQEEDGEKAAAYLQQWYARQSEFQKKRLRLSLDKQEYVMEKAHADLEQFFRTLPPALTQKYHPDYQAIHKEYFQEWEKHKYEVATKEQRFRTYNFDNYMDKVDELVSKMEGEKALRNQGISFPVRKKTGPSLGREIKLFPGLLSSLMKIGGPRLFRKKIKPRKTPLTTDAAKLFRRLGKLFQYQVVIEGRENIPPQVENPSPGSKDIYFFFPPHKNGLMDAVLLGNLKLPHFIVFANPKTFVPWEKTASRLQKAPEFVAVGPWRGKKGTLPGDKVFDSLETGISSNVFLFPTGFVSNIGEFLPIRQEFSNRIIGQAIEKGYNPVIIPLATEVDSAFLSQMGSSRVDDRETSLKILPPLPGAFVKFLKAFEDRPDSPKDVFDIVITSLWEENTKKHTELPLQEVERRIQEGFGYIFGFGQRPKGLECVKEY